MPSPSVLPAGTTIARDPNQLLLAPDLTPFLRLSDPFDIVVSAGCGYQLDRACMLENRGPVATHAEVIAHNTGTETFIALGAAQGRLRQSGRTSYRQTTPLSPRGY